MKDKVHVLQVVPNMRSAGIENFIMNLYRNIDTNKIQFDFLVHSEIEQEFDKEIIKRGGKIYRLTYKDDKNIFKYIKDLNRFFKNHPEYQIVHGEMQSMMPLYLYIAKKHHVKCRIAHAHNSSYEKTFKGFILHIFSRFAKFSANIYWACSISAGKYLYGNKEFTVINNAIDQDKFKYNESKRKSLRKELNLDNSFVIGHIGRFELQKNHDFLIDIFNEILKIEPNAVLLSIGDGYLKNKIIKKVKELNIEKNVKFIGIVNNSYDYYQAMDCFILPSLYEGLPLVGVEAQIAGLNCFFSNSITAELNLTNNVEFIDLNLSPKIWAEKICQTKYSKRVTNYIDEYDLKRESKIVENMYIKMNH